MSQIETIFETNLFPRDGNIILKLRDGI